MTTDNNTIRVLSNTMYEEFLRILLKNGFSAERGKECAHIFTVNSLEGVYSHGVNRFPRFISNIIDGYVKPDALPTLIKRSGSLEQWDGNVGPGPLNAAFATERVMELARENGIGMITLANTNHWMRAGAYGWQAARNGYVLICWTNTCPNMPAWGAKDPRLGNNPFVLAVPYKNEAIVLDFAMSQYSYGKMENYKRDGMKLPYQGGFNKGGDLTSDPGAILEAWRPLPVGYWKGSALSLLLDILATVLSGGLSTHQVKSCESESKLSQVFIAVHLESLSNFPSIESSIDQIISNVKGSDPVDDKTVVRYPGENIPDIRETNLREGIPVNRKIWEKISGL